MLTEPTIEHHYSEILSPGNSDIERFIKNNARCIVKEPTTVTQRLTSVPLALDEKQLLLIVTNLVHFTSSPAYSWSHLLTDLAKPLVYLQYVSPKGYRFYFKCDGAMYSVTAGVCPDGETDELPDLYDQYPSVINRITFLLRDVAKHYDEKRDKFYQLPFTNVKIEII